MSSIAIDLDETVEPAQAFSWWEDLNTPYTEGTTLSDWVATPYRDVVCFQRSEADVDAFMVRRGQMLHFGFDMDTLESAYESLAPRHRETTSIAVRRPAYLWRQLANA